MNAVLSRPAIRAEAVSRRLTLDLDGGALSDPRSLAGSWQRPPFVAALRLMDGAEVLQTAWISTRGAYAEYAARVARISRLLLERAGPGMAGSAEPARGRPGLRGRLRRQAEQWRARLYSEWWSVGISERPIAAALRPDGLGPIAWLRPAPGTAYWADPFAWPGTDRLLVEEYAVSGGPGVIVALRPEGAGWVRDRALPGEAAHRSYPFTHAEDGRVLLLVECVDRGAIVLQSLAADGTTGPLAVVAAGAYADPTFFRDGGRCWVAATDLGVGAHDNLCLFYAERPEGPWRPHRGNPVKIDIRSARPAGTPFLADGVLYRPAQDCAAGYGAAVVLNRVLTLTPDSFLEEAVRRIAPDPAGPLPDGLHTASAWDGRTLVDGKRLVFAPQRAAGRALRRVLRRPA